jgi:hypothetical protein
MISILLYDDLIYVATKQANKEFRVAYTKPTLASLSHQSFCFKSDKVRNIRKEAKVNKFYGKERFLM